MLETTTVTSHGMQGKMGRMELGEAFLKTADEAKEVKSRTQTAVKKRQEMQKKAHRGGEWKDFEKTTGMKRRKKKIEEAKAAKKRNLKDALVKIAKEAHKWSCKRLKNGS